MDKRFKRPQSRASGILALVGAFVMVAALLLAGCSSNGATTTTAPEGSSSTDTTVAGAGADGNGDSGDGGRRVKRGNEIHPSQSSNHYQGEEEDRFPDSFFIFNLGGSVNPAGSAQTTQ